MTDDEQRAADMALIRAAITASGLSTRRFATEVLIREERTIRRWLAGHAPIPKQVRIYLETRIRDGPVSDSTV